MGTGGGCVGGSGGGGDGVHSNIYVAGLPEGVFDETNFREMFEEYGYIISSKCVLGKYGFVKFSSSEEAQGCVDALNGLEIQGSIISVKFADNDLGQSKHVGKADHGKSYGKGPPQPISHDNLYVKGLPNDMTEDQLGEIFNKYGQIVSFKLMAYAENASAMIRMATPDSARWLVENLDGNVPEGLTDPIVVKYANDSKGAAKGAKGVAKGATKGAKSGYGKAALESGKGPYKGSSPYGDSVQELPGFNCSDPEVLTAMRCVVAALGQGKVWTEDGDPSNLYIKDLPGTADDLYLYRLFAPFGSVQSVFVKPGDDGTWAVGFVKYARPQDAAKAIKGINGIQLPDGNTLMVQVKQAKMGGARQAVQHQQQLQPQPPPGPPPFQW